MRPDGKRIMIGLDASFASDTCRPVDDEDLALAHIECIED